MIRVLQIMDNLNEGGIQAFVMNCYRNIDRQRVQFDFLVFKPGQQLYEEEIVDLGGIVYKCAGRREGIKKCHNDIKKFFINHKYDVVHYHASSLSFIAPIYYAKKNGVRTRIIHCHSSSFIGNKIHILLHKIHRMQIASYANIYLSCSSEATKWMFGGTEVESKVKILINGISIDKYKCLEDVRNQYRERLELKDCFVMGHVGRFSEVKNHKFLIDVFREVKKNINNAKLLLVGDGELRNSIENLTLEYQLDKDVIFLGRRNDIPSLLMSMDVFVLPSKYEGFPVVAVEAQASGLPVVMSDSITKDVAINDNVVRVSLGSSPKEWAIYILKFSTRNNDVGSLIEAGFDIENTIKDLYTLYEIGCN